MKNPLRYILPRRLFDKTPTIPVVKLTGMIASKGGRMQTVLSLESCAALLDKAFQNKHAKAVALIINSPGGSPVQSRMIYQRIRDLATEHDKKVLVFVEDVAASGGYMIACAGDEIYADPSSVVGSIGVVSASFGFPKLLDKLGIERRVYTAGKNKVSLDPFSEEKPNDIAHLKDLQLQIHQVFIDLVKTSRKEKLQDDENLFTGMFWTGMKAKELGLIDDLGDIRSVIKNQFGEKAKMELLEPSRNFLGQVKHDSAVKVLNHVGQGEWTEQMTESAVQSLSKLADERSLYGRYGL